MNVRKIVIALKTKLVYQNTVLTPALEQPVVKVQYVMPLATEPNALVHVDFKVTTYLLYVDKCGQMWTDVDI